MRQQVRAFLLLVATVLACGPANSQVPELLPATGFSDPRAAPLDDLMTSFLSKHKIPGAALAVARNGRLLYARGFGFADLSLNKPVHPDSLFRIASVSKPFTAAAIMQLIEQGKLSLDDHPFAMPGFMPTFKEGQKPDDRLYKITIRNLLSHAGGFKRNKSGDPMYMLRRIATDLDIPSPPAPADIIRWMAARPLDFEPGTKSVYSNFGYCVLGRVVESVSGESYERYVQGHILNPLGITDMRIARTLESGRAKREVHYYSNDDAGPSVFDGFPGKVASPYGIWSLESSAADGGWIASAPDLVRFAAALGEPGKVLSKESLATLWSRPAHPRSWAAFWEGGYYAFGWYVQPKGKWANTWHRGTDSGTSALLVRRQDGFVWAVLFNTREGQPARKIAKLIHKAVDKVKQWPEGEPLFPTGSTAPPTPGP